jgi:hypothetical protein
MTIGITPVHLLPTTPDGPPQAVQNQSTTHVLSVGVFLMVIAMVFGQKLWALRYFSKTSHYTIVLIMVLTSPASSVQMLSSGILSRVLAFAMTAISAATSTAASIGLHLLTAMLRITFASQTLATYLCHTTPHIDRTGSPSAA